MSRLPDRSDRAEVLSRWTVSRETATRLDAYEALTQQWQKHINLIAPSTLGHIWTRHIEDGLWLDKVAGPQLRWVDIGSGGGFPGLVLACLAAEREGASVELVESSGKKCAFMRTVIRELGLPARVHCGRIENSGAVLAGASAISARALASLDALLGLVSPHIGQEVVCYFLKGRAHDEEIASASAHWRFAMVKHSSRAEPESVILALQDIAPLGR